jgi:colanic acid biosynthesis glycosyl transferase WcaI
MRVGIISQWYKPEPAFIPVNLADELAARGHEVRVLTGFPNYPTGRVYPGYRQRWNHHSADGDVAIRRVPLYANHDASGVRRAASYLSFAATSSLAAPRFLGRVDVVYVYLTPATAYTAAAVLRRLRGIPAVIHVQDIWPESVTESSMAPGGPFRGVAFSILGAVMRRVYGSAARVAVIAPSMRDLVIERGADPASVRVVLNWADESLFHPVESTPETRAEIGYRGRCTVMYAGTMGPFQNIPNSVRAAASVDDIDLVLVGSGVEEDSARRLTAELGATNVRFLGRREPSAMAALYAAADYQLVTLRDLPIFRGTIPSKLPTALSCASPVVVSVPGDCADLVTRTGVGLACPPDDWTALAAGFRDAAALDPDARAEMSRRALESYRAQMSMRAGVDQLEDMLLEAAAS